MAFDDINDDNPYAFNDSTLDASIDDTPSANFYVDGDQVYGAAPIRLPAICPKTGETTDLVEVRKTLNYAPPWIYITLFVGGLCVLLIVYLIVRKSCDVTYYLSREVRNKHRNFNIIGGSSIFGSIALFVGLLASSGPGDDPGLLLLVPLVLFFVGLICLVMGGNVITIAKHVNGTQFWLKGFKPEFFNELRRQYDQ